MYKLRPHEENKMKIHNKWRYYDANKQAIQNERKNYNEDDIDDVQLIKSNDGAPYNCYCFYSAYISDNMPGYKPGTLFKASKQIMPYTSSILFVCLTLKPELYKLSSRTQYRKSIKNVIGIMSNLTTKFIAIHELTEQNNIHYHLAVEPKDPELFQYILLDNLKSNKHSLGHVMTIDKPKAYENYHNLLKYMFKDIQRTNKIINDKKTNIIQSYLMYPFELVQRKRALKSLKSIILDKKTIERDDSTNSDTQMTINKLNNQIILNL